MKELNKIIQDLKIEVETIKKSQRKTTLEIKNLGKKSGVIDASTKNRTQEKEERTSHAENTIENIESTVKKCKMQKPCNPKYPGNPEHNKTKPKDHRYRRKQRFTA